MRVWKEGDGTREVGIPISWDLGFDLPFIGKGKGKGKEKERNKGRAETGPRAKLDSLADANSFLAWALGRNRINKWTDVLPLTTKINEVGQGPAFWRVELRLIAEEETKLAVRVEVTAPRTNSSDGKVDLLPRDAEMCAKMEIIRALVSPSQEPTDVSFRCSLHPPS